MSQNVSAWTIPGPSGEVILGDCHLPHGDARGVVLIVHGFLGYKDYGMFPAIACAFADAGFIAHRFNLSHSGMTNSIETFARPDLFEGDTWRIQVADVIEVGRAIDAGQLAGADLPFCLVGHSRGGDTCLLTAAELFERGDARTPAAVVTAAAPSALCRMDEAVQSMLLQEGHLEHKSNRTGQTLRIGRAWLQDQLDDPAWHDLISRVASISCPMLFVHGQDDPTVSAADALELANAARAGEMRPSVKTRLILGANHVFNAPNPLPEGAPLPETLVSLIDGAVRFCAEATGADKD